MNPLIERIRQDLVASSDEKTRNSFQRFFTEKVTCYGVKTGTVSKIAKKYWSEIKSCGKREVFALCEKLYSSGVTEEAFVAASWLPNLVEAFVPEDIKTFEAWIDRYVDNWAKCDGLCNHTIGSLITKYPECVAELKKWATSDNRWLRRASASSLIIPAKRGDFLQDTFDICDTLLQDKEDMVQKGYGWLLKEASRKHQMEVFSYVLRNRKRMPRTALRYAIELMSKDLKDEAMKKE